VTLDREDIDAIVAALGSRREPFYTVQTLADLLGLSDRQVRRMAKDGRISHYMVEGQYRFDQVDVDAYLQQRREEAA
jgi:excisionase family DNA binding protein